MRRMLSFIFLASCLFVLIGCGQQPSEEVLAYEENNEIIGQERDEIIGEVSDTIYDSIDRNNVKAEEMIVGPIEGLGEDVTPPEGRYTISAGVSSTGYPQSGRVLVYDEDGVLLLEELLDYSSVGRVTVNLNGSHTVHIDGLEEAKFIPTDTVVSNELSTGIWEVGVDIEAGKYSVFPASDIAFGDLHVYEKGQSPRLFEFLDASPESNITIELKEGQKLRLSGLSLLRFDPV